MHDTARATGRLFFETYGRTDINNVLDIGSFDVNGTLKHFAPVGVSYVGCDISEGPNVNVVLTDPHKFPWPENTYDLVISTSCFEHDKFFWLTFAEMARVAKKYVYINVPVGGAVHRHPIDCWRFYPDAGLALAEWSRHVGHGMKLVESFIHPTGEEGWTDFAAVFAKASVHLPGDRLVYNLSNLTHVYLE